MKENSSNILIKTIIFVLTIALSCIIFFGFMDGVKSEMDYTKFGLILFAETVLYIAIIISSKKKSGRLNSADITSFGVLYFITNIITNGCISSIKTLKDLLLINSVEVIIFMILICIVLLKKKTK